jgi:hypothetical protein
VEDVMAPLRANLKLELAGERQAVVVGTAVLAQDVTLAHALVDAGVPALMKHLLEEGTRDVQLAAAACVACLTAHAAPTADDPLVSTNLNLDTRVGYTGQRVC